MRFSDSISWSLFGLSEGTQPSTTALQAIAKPMQNRKLFISFFFPNLMTTSFQQQENKLLWH
jgi:hypothetical protein